MTPESAAERTNGPVHGWFELTYANYQVLPRVLMQSMPLDWQRRMVVCLDELRVAFQDVDQPAGYRVETGAFGYVNELSDEAMRLAGVTSDLEEAAAELDPMAEDYDERYAELEVQHEGCYHDADGTELRSPDRVFVPGPDPLPHYDRGRTYIPPDENALQSWSEFLAENGAQ